MCSDTSRLMDPSFHAHLANLKTNKNKTLLKNGLTESMAYNGPPCRLSIIEWLCPDDDQRKDSRAQEYQRDVRRPAFGWMM